MGEDTTGQGESTELSASARAYELTRAVLSAGDDRDAGARAARAVAASVLAEAGVEGLAAVTFDLSLALASALERIASDHRLVAIDLAEAWFME